MKWDSTGGDVSTLDSWLLTDIQYGQKYKEITLNEICDWGREYDMKWTITCDVLFVKRSNASPCFFLLLMWPHENSEADCVHTSPWSQKLHLYCGCKYSLFPWNNPVDFLRIIINKKHEGTRSVKIMSTLSTPQTSTAAFTHRHVGQVWERVQKKKTYLFWCYLLSSWDGRKWMSTLERERKKDRLKKNVDLGSKKAHTQKNMGQQSETSVFLLTWKMH